MWWRRGERVSEKGKKLLEAAKAGNLESVRKLLNDHADVNFNDENGRTVLHWASWLGRFVVIKELLARGASVNAASNNGETALHVASLHGHSEVVNALLARGASVDATRYDAWTALHLASKYGRLDIVKELLARGASVDLANNDGWTALHLASREGHLDIVKELLARGASVDAANKYGETALFLASMYGHFEVVKELLARGASVDVANKFYATALHLASKYGHLDIVQELLARGASVDAADIDGEMALNKASREGYFDVVQELLARGASVDVANNDGETALHEASRGGRLEILKVLLDAGANMKYMSGKTARDLGNGKVKAFFDNYYGSDKALFDSYYESKIYSIQSATDWIRQTLEDVKDRSTDLVATGSVVLNLSLEVKIHRQQVLVVGVLVADALRHTTHQDSLSEHQALLSVLKNIETNFQTNLTAFQPWTLQANAHSVSNVPETISHLKEELIKSTRNFNINPRVEVLGSVQEDLRLDLAKMMDKLENIDKCLEIVQKLPDHRQIDAFVELLIQFERGLEYYKRQVAFGNIQHSIDFEEKVKFFRGKVCSTIDGIYRARGISNDFLLDKIEPWMLSSEEVEYDPNDHSLVLGRGGFATVFKGRYYGQAVAVKRFDQIVNMDSVGLEKMIAKEINGWKDISHEPYILNLVGVCAKSPTPILVSELCRTNIRRYIRDRPEMLLTLVYQFACGLACIHKVNIIHRDLKGDNVLVTYQGTVAIADFGLSRTVTSLENTNTSVTRAGTLNWMSPEQYFMPRSVTAKSDVWSFGMTLWEILCDETPFRQCSEYEFRDEIYQTENDRPEKPENLRPDHEPLWTLMTKCWRLKPEARPSSDEIVEFLKNEFASQLEGF
ncbi:hypothetical protein AeMF1_002545 [Aphanomyces euteiches]|nr:hypothetical protein AeMF1_002545 [Aphanomyces euteiches]